MMIEQRLLAAVDSIERDKMWLGGSGMRHDLRILIVACISLAASTMFGVEQSNARAFCVDATISQTAKKQKFSDRYNTVFLFKIINMCRHSVTVYAAYRCPSDDRHYTTSAFLKAGQSIDKTWNMVHPQGDCQTAVYYNDSDGQKVILSNTAQPETVSRQVDVPEAEGESTPTKDGARLTPATSFAESLQVCLGELNKRPPAGIWLFKSESDCVSNEYDSNEVKIDREYFGLCRKHNEDTVALCNAINSSKSTRDILARMKLRSERMAELAKDYGNRVDAYIASIENKIKRRNEQKPRRQRNNCAVQDGSGTCMDLGGSIH